MNNKNKVLLSASVVAILANTPTPAEVNPFQATKLRNGYANKPLQLASSSMHSNKMSESSCGKSHMKMNNGKCGGSMGMNKKKMKKHMKEQDKATNAQANTNNEE